METQITKQAAEQNGFHLFGNKGDVWNNTAHLSIYNEPVTLCGRPMLSNNWVRIEGIKEVGCADCARRYNQLINPKS